MGMKCFVCNKKLNIFSDYTQIKVNDKKVEICTPCNHKREKEDIKKLLQTDEGKKDVSLKGTTLICTGVLEITVGATFVYLLNSFLQLFSFILIGFGIYSIYKGLLYKSKTKK